MRFFVKVATSTIGLLCTSASAYCMLDEQRRDVLLSGIVLRAHDSSTTPQNNINAESPSSPIRSAEPWNWNWDGLQHQYKPSKSRVVRHIYLIRHGQYDTQSHAEDGKQLTALGKEQADWTGQALVKSNIPFTRLVQSGLIRAIQTVDGINKYLKFTKIEKDVDLNEGFPFLPEPPGRYPAEVNKGRIILETERLERAFRQFLHRPLPSQTQDSHELIVCHANVIRYFTCRALQIPADAWLRFNLHHCSITHLVITTDGRVICYGIGDVGHIPQERRSLRRPSKNQQEAINPCGLNNPA